MHYWRDVRRVIRNPTRRGIVFPVGLILFIESAQGVPRNDWLPRLAVRDRQKDSDRSNCWDSRHLRDDV
eukprot:scaffold3214_cov113-Cylindrotheca_fusiformis.AAC.5